jgi:hypothetical protein
MSGDIPGSGSVEVWYRSSRVPFQPSVKAIVYAGSAAAKRPFTRCLPAIRQMGGGDEIQDPSSESPEKRLPGGSQGVQALWVS